MWRDWKPYVPVSARRRNAEREMEKLKSEGYPVSPVAITGNAIAETFWGKAWCDNLESYSDYSNRLPRGRSYVRNGAVVDLQIEPGKVKALVSGSDIYEVDISVSAVPDDQWSAICADCAGGIDSLVELLQGRFSDGVMERICQQSQGLFPTPAEIKFSCSCPDWASMCKHVSAVLYGVGARLDEQPELLFKLRDVDGKDLIVKAGAGLPLSKKGPAADKVLVDDGLSELFGLELNASEEKLAVKIAPKSPKPAVRPRVALIRIARTRPPEPTPKRVVKNAEPSLLWAAPKRVAKKAAPARLPPTPKRVAKKAAPARLPPTPKRVAKKAAPARLPPTPKRVAKKAAPARLPPTPKRVAKKAAPARLQIISKRTVKKTAPAQPRPTPKRLVKKAAPKRTAKIPTSAARTKSSIKAKTSVTANKKMRALRPQVKTARPAKKKKR